MLLGPTASGKTAAALAIAERLPVEIVSVDSALVYRGLDIGTAKPSAAERQRVAHHLIDLIEPTDSYSAARFVADADAAIAAIRARGRQPLLVGGTMLYAKAFAEGLHALPQADPAVRRRLEEEAAQLGWPALHARLARLDPASAARLEPGDSQRIQRALEVVELSGRPLSEWLADTRCAADTRPPVSIIALEPSSRTDLHARIATRFEAMLAAGFVDEVRRLRARGDLHTNLPSMRCVGYRQLWQWFEAGAPDGPAWQAAVAAGISATRQLAKRQLTWLRAMPQRQVVDCLAPDAVARVLALIGR
ncbi:MAG: tRNA (adenosine(37)-N6)-dimethylallyltransferase MiaA [Burkholderiaceae bacterium]